MVNSTNFIKSSINPTGYGVVDKDPDVLLLQSGDSFLLQNGTDSLLLGGSGELQSLNYSKSSINSTNYSN